MCRAPGSRLIGNGCALRKSASMKLAFVVISTIRTSSCMVSEMALSQVMDAYRGSGSVKVASFLQPSARATTQQANERTRVIATLTRERLMGIIGRSDPVESYRYCHSRQTP